MEPFVGEIRAFLGSFAPVGWAFCSGQQLQITQYQLLYTLIGTTYGGDGRLTFNLPNLNGRAITHIGQGTNLSNYVLGQTAGQEGVAVTTAAMPSHTHAMAVATVPGTGNAPTGLYVAEMVDANNPTGTVLSYLSASHSPTITTLNNNTVSTAGGAGYPHENRQPYTVVSYIIALNGIFPQT